MGRSFLHFWLSVSLTVAVVWGNCPRCAPEQEQAAHDCCKPAKQEQSSKKPCPNDSRGIKDFEKSESNLSKLKPAPAAFADAAALELLPVWNSVVPRESLAASANSPPELLLLISTLRI